MAFNEDSSASGHDEPWIQWFCGLKGHEMFCEVERSYIEDGFNLYGLRTCVSNFSDCLDLILDRIGPDDSDDSHLTQNACTLYGLIHARYIITAHGLDSMYNKVRIVLNTTWFTSPTATDSLLFLNSMLPRSLELVRWFSVLDSLCSQWGSRMRLGLTLSKSSAPNANVFTTPLRFDLGATTTEISDPVAVPGSMVLHSARPFRISSS